MKKKAELILTAEDKASRKLRNLASEAGKVGSKLKSIGKAATLGLTVPLAAAAIGATKLASDLNETISKTDAVFGSSADSIKKWSESANKSMGLSQRAALDLSSRFGGALKTIGQVSESEAAKVSQRLTGLSADLNSFFNREDAGDAISSALTGEFEPLKKFNVIINDAILKQKALTQGTYSGTGALTAQAKQMATLAILTEQTNDAQGDFARTSEGLANQTRILQAKLEDAGAGIGQKLLPVALKLAEWANDALDQFSGLSEKMQTFALIGGGLAAAIGPLLIVGGQLFTVFSAVAGAIASAGGVTAALGSAFAVLTGPIGLTVAAVVGGVALIVANWETVKAAAGALVATVTAQFNAWRVRNAETIAAISASFSSIWSSMQRIGAVIASTVSSAVAKLNEMLAPIGGLEGAFEILKSVALSQLDAITSAVSNFFSLVSTVFSNIADVLEGNKSAWQALKDVVSTVASAIHSRVVSLVSEIASAFKSVDWTSLGKNVIQGIANGISAGAGAVADSAKNAANSALCSAKQALGIKSPSREFIKIGKFTMAGLAIGIMSGTATAEQSAEVAALKVLNKYEETIASRGKSIAETLKMATGSESGLASVGGGGGFGGGSDFGGGGGGDFGGGFGGGGIDIPGAAEIEALAAFHDQKLAILQEKGLQETEVAKAIELDKMNQLASIRQMAISGYGAAFDSVLDLTRAFAGEQSGIYKAMFAATKAFAIAESVVKIQQGIASAAALPFPANLGAMATVAGATASIISTIKGTEMPSYDGGGFTGFGARAGGLDGKGGFPAMLHPNESVIDHTKGQGASPVNLTITINGDPNPTVVENIIEASKSAATQFQHEMRDRGGNRSAMFS